MQAQGIPTALAARDLREPLAQALQGASIAVVQLDTLPKADPTALIAVNLSRLSD